MSESVAGEFSAYQSYRDAGLQYLDVLHNRASVPNQVVEARSRFMALRSTWHLLTASIDGRVSMMQALLRVA